MKIEERLKRCEEASDALERRIWTPNYAEISCPLCERRIDHIAFRLRKSREIYECPKCEQVIAKSHRDARVLLQCNGKTTWREDMIFFVLGILPEDWAWSVIGVLGICYEKMQEAYWDWSERWESLRG
jgi:ribosomal protein L37AE/L43A